MSLLLDFFHWFQDNFLHLDQALERLVSLYGPWIYAILFALVFGETGLVILPFLPGDSLLFAVGAYAVSHPGAGLSWPLAMALLILAAILGNLANFAIGGTLGARIFKEKALVLRREYLDRAHAFFEKHGPKAVILARFLPFFLALVPFVAGMAAMGRRRFLLHTAVGSVLWVVLTMSSGIFFGRIPWVKTHFEAVVIGIILVSMLPAAYEMAAHFLASRRAAAARRG